MPGEIVIPWQSKNLRLSDFISLSLADLAYTVGDSNKDEERGRIEAWLMVGGRTGGRNQKNMSAATLSLVPTHSTLSLTHTHLSLTFV
jgi:hypothetical protein